VPAGWRAADPPGNLIKVPVKNMDVLRALREQIPGRWIKVYRKGKDGAEVHYFEHASGAIANVKYKDKSV
jgi:hypothetical protein